MPIVHATNKKWVKEKVTNEKYCCCNRLYLTWLAAFKSHSRFHYTASSALFYVIGRRFFCCLYHLSSLYMRKILSKFVVSRNEINTSERLFKRHVRHVKLISHRWCVCLVLMDDWFRYDLQEIFKWLSTKCTSDLIWITCSSLLH